MISMDASEALRLDSVRKIYGTADNSVTALDGVSLRLLTGTFTAVMGPSGSGKSTLLSAPPAWTGPPRAPWRRRPASRGSEAAYPLRRNGSGSSSRSSTSADADRVENVALPLRLAGRTSDKSVCRAARQRRPRRPARPPAGRAVRRPAAARRDRPGARHPTERDLRRRADRRPRQRAAAARCSRCCATRRQPRADGRHGDPRSGRGRRTPTRWSSWRRPDRRRTGATHRRPVAERMTHLADEVAWLAPAGVRAMPSATSERCGSATY